MQKFSTVKNHLSGIHYENDFSWKKLQILVLNKNRGTRLYIFHLILNFLGSFSAMLVGLISIQNGLLIPESFWKLLFHNFRFVYHFFNFLPQLYKFTRFEQIFFVNIQEPTDAKHNSEGGTAKTASINCRTHVRDERYLDILRNFKIGRNVNFRF